MTQQINVNIRMNKEIKEQADRLFNELGFSFTAAINAFIKQALRERAIPFYIKANDLSFERKALKEAFKAIREQSVVNGTDRITMEEIDAEIAACRYEKREQQ